MDGDKIDGLQFQDQRHDPGEHGSDQNDDNGIGEAFQPGAKIQLGKVNTAGDKRKARNDKQHGTDITGFMEYGNMQCQFCHFQQESIDQTGTGYGQRYV